MGEYVTLHLSCHILMTLYMSRHAIVDTPRTVCGRVYVTVWRPSVRLSHLTTTAAACSWFPAVDLLGRRY